LFIISSKSFYLYVKQSYFIHYVYIREICVFYEVEPVSKLSLFACPPKPRRRRVRSLCPMLYAICLQPFYPEPVEGQSSALVFFPLKRSAPQAKRSKRLMLRSTPRVRKDAPPPAAGSALRPMLLFLLSPVFCLLTSVGSPHWSINRELRHQTDTPASAMKASRMGGSTSICSDPNVST
jgi:hypothetical protein